MSTSEHFIRKKLLPTVLSASMLLACALPASAAEPIGDGVAPTFDEAYYATLDYYGNLTEGTVVKSYILNGATRITDFGTYDEVVNLTDNTAPILQNGTASFQFAEDHAPSHFYFEGKTKAPFENLPWSITISYALNGVPARAEDLAGKTGVVEIRADVIPNEGASEYARYNYTLQAMALFNQDDILSLEAPGAQVQLIGNLRTAMFMALPGEEHHFVIRVGTDDFSFDGMTFMMVPATLGQLEDIAKLNERKDELEQHYHELSAGIDQLLGSFSSLGGSLRATADGLRQINSAREVVSAEKEMLYEQSDAALGDLEIIRTSLDSMSDHLENTGQGVDDVMDSLTSLSDTAVQLNRDLGDLIGCLEELETDLNALRAKSGSLESGLNKVGEDLKRLEDALNRVRGSLEKTDRIGACWDRVSSGRFSKISSEDFKAAALIDGGYAGNKTDALAVLDQAAAAQATGEKIAAFRAEDPDLADSSDEAVIEAMLAAETPVITRDEADCYIAIKPRLAELSGLAGLSDKVYSAICSGEKMNREQFFAAMLLLHDAQNDPGHTGELLADAAKYKIRGISAAALSGTSGLILNLTSLLDRLGTEGAIGSLSSMLSRTDQALLHLAETLDTAGSVLSRVRNILTELDSLGDTVKDRIPGLHETLDETGELLGVLSSAASDTHTFLTGLRDLIREAGGRLDAGTKQSLDNLAATLYRTADSTDAVGGVRSAKDTMSTIIEDTWNEVTGEHSNLLMMNASAEAQSMTSERNAAPTSLQVLIRTQEIKPIEEELPSPPSRPESPTTFLGRVGRMFRDFGHSIAKIFSRH